ITGRNHSYTLRYLKSQINFLLWPASTVLPLLFAHLLAFPDRLHESALYRPIPEDSMRRDVRQKGVAFARSYLHGFPFVSSLYTIMRYKEELQGLRSSSALLMPYIQKHRIVR